MPLRIAVSKAACGDKEFEVHVLSGHTAEDDREILGERRSFSVIEFHGSSYNTLNALISHDTASGKFMKLAIEEVCRKMLELGKTRATEKLPTTSIDAGTPTYPPP